MHMEFLSQLTLLQWLGTIFGVLQVLLARQNNIHNYLFGMVAILISIWVLYQSQLYADIVLNLYYLAMSIYGWFYWKSGKQKRKLPFLIQAKKNIKLLLALYWDALF